MLKKVLGLWKVSFESLGQKLQKEKDFLLSCLSKAEGGICYELVPVVLYLLPAL